MRTRWFKRIAAALLLLSLTVAVAAWLLLRASLPRLDGSIAASGLGSPVRIERDALGTVSIAAQTRADAAYALGYVHGQERFFEMDLLRRRAASCRH
jgi:penicillin amidase